MQTPYWIISFLLNILLLILSYYLYKKYNKYKEQIKQESVFGKWKIPKISLAQLDSVFTPDEFGVSMTSQVQFLGSAGLVAGGTSELEAWILATLAKKANQIFEFGTCTGKSTYLMATNAPTHAKVYTITLSPDTLSEYHSSKTDSKASVHDAIEESKFTKFVYSGTACEQKITQLFGDSKKFDEQPYTQKIDLIFVDGSHAYSYVKSDSEKALKMVTPNGLILWHDYRGPNHVKDVYKALNELSTTLPLFHIAGTSLVVYRKS